VEDQKAFAATQRFGYQLLSDTTKEVGRAYDVERAPGEPYAEYGLPRRVTYLIRPGGEIAKAYDLAAHPDLTRHAEELLTDLLALQQG
jgi:peroxiredoxin